MSKVVDIAKQLADEFRPRAAEYDRTGEFPKQNYDDMRAAGYLRAIVPEELGGLGADLATISRGQQALARGCASTALAVNMHQFQVGTFSDAFRAGQPVEPLLRRVADEGIVIGSLGAEAIVAGEWTCPTTAEKTEGGWRLNGRKFFFSQAPGVTLARLLARDAATGETLIFMIPMTTPGMKVVETWDTTGMRATASHDLVLENVEVPDTAMGARLPGKEPMRAAPLLNVARWFLPLMSSVYLGIAEEAREEAYKAIGGGINSNSRHQVLTDALIGEMEMHFIAAQAARDRIIEELTPAPKPDDLPVLASRGILAKEVVTRSAAAVVDKAVEIAGGRSYFRKSPLERLSRDVRAARFHPPATPISFQIAGERLREARGVAG